MKIETTVTIYLSAAAIVGGIILNFPEFLMGSPATAKNLIVTFAYLFIWALILRRGIKSKHRGIVKYCLLFWSITLFVSIVTAYVNVTSAIVDWAIPLGILFLPQLYGISLFVESFFTASVIIACISLVIILITAVSLKSIKHS